LNKNYCANEAYKNRTKILNSWYQKKKHHYKKSDGIFLLSPKSTNHSESIKNIFRWHITKAVL
jgi:hypothetical protein